MIILMYVNCFIVSAHRRMWSVTNYFLLNLSVADILMAALNCTVSFLYMRDRLETFLYICTLDLICVLVGLKWKDFNKLYIFPEFGILGQFTVVWTSSYLCPRCPPVSSPCWPSPWRDGEQSWSLWGPKLPGRSSSSPSSPSGVSAPW